MAISVDELRKDLVEIFDEEYEKRRLITADFVSIRLAEKGYQKQTEAEWEFVEVLPMRGAIYRCTNCKEKFNSQALQMKHCSECGAKMKMKDA